MLTQTQTLTKRFKEFDRKFNKLRGSALKTFDTASLAEANRITEWKYRHEYITDYSPRAIADAVYDSETAEQWQKIRVSLKGLTTGQKLFFLQGMWEDMCEYSVGHEEVARIEIRINNYLGALIRGGLLNSKLEVIG